MAHIVDRLQTDQDSIRDIFGRIHRTTDGSMESREALYGLLERHFTVQTVFAEQVFYPAVREADDAGSQGVDLVIGKAIDERHEILDLLQTTTDRDSGSVEFVRAATALERLVEAHFEREREEIFPLALRVIVGEEAEEMSARHEVLAREVLEQEGSGPLVGS